MSFKAKYLGCITSMELSKRRKRRMDKIKVNKSELLAIMEKNRESHRAVFLEAIEGYRIKAIELLEKAVEDAKNNKVINTVIQLSRPKDYTHEYDILIGMLKMSSDEFVEIDDVQYRNYVMDEWSWTKDWVSSNSTYCSSSSSMSTLSAKASRSY